MIRTTLGIEPELNEDEEDDESYRPRRPSYLCATRCVTSPDHLVLQSDQQPVGIPNGGHAIGQYPEIKTTAESDAKLRTSNPVGRSVETFVSPCGRSDYSIAAETILESISPVDYQLPNRSGDINGGSADPSIYSISYSAVSAPSNSTLTLDWRRYKDVVILSGSFLLVLTSVFALLSLETSILESSSVANAILGLFYFSSMIANFFAPNIVYSITPKWTIALGFFLQLGFFVANLLPHLLVLSAASVTAGFGHGLLSTAQTAYVRNLIVGSVRHPKHLSVQLRMRAAFARFESAFQAVVQTAHLWGNIVSSLTFSLAGDKINRAAETANNVAGSCGAIVECSRHLSDFNASLPGIHILTHTRT